MLSYTILANMYWGQIQTLLSYQMSYSSARDGFVNTCPFVYRTYARSVVYMNGTHTFFTYRPSLLFFRIDFLDLVIVMMMKKVSIWVQYLVDQWMSEKGRGWKIIIFLCIFTFPIEKVFFYWLLDRESFLFYMMIFPIGKVRYLNISRSGKLYQLSSLFPDWAKCTDWYG